MCVPRFIYNDGEIYTLVLLLSGSFPFPPSSSLSPFHLSPNNGQIPAPQDSWRRPAKPLCLLAPPQGLPGWDSWRSLDARPVSCPHHGSHHGMLGMSAEPLCCTVSEGASSISERADLVRKCGEGVFIWILVNLTVFQVHCFFFLKKEKEDKSKKKNILGELAKSENSECIHIEHVVFLICQRRWGGGLQLDISETSLSSEFSHRKFKVDTGTCKPSRREV